MSVWLRLGESSEEEDGDDNLPLIERMKVTKNEVNLTGKRKKTFTKNEQSPKNNTSTTRSKGKSILEIKVDESKKKRKERKEIEEFSLRDEPSDMEALNLKSGKEEEVEEEEECKFMWNCQQEGKNP